jgi:hypothetical protein
MFVIYLDMNMYPLIPKQVASRSILQRTSFAKWVIFDPYPPADTSTDACSRFGDERIIMKSGRIGGLSFKISTYVSCGCACLFMGVSVI